METEFSAEEIQKIVQSAHIIAPTLTQEQLEKLFEIEGELARSGFVEIAWSLHRLEKERGVTLEQSLPYLEQLLAEIQKLQREAAAMEEAHKVWQGRIEADKQAAERARQERLQAEAELATLRKQAETEKKEMAKAAARARQEAQVSLAEIEECQKLKAEATSRGLALPFVLWVCQGLEVAPDATERLLRQMKKNSTLAEANAAAEKQQEALGLHIAQSQETAAGLDKRCHEQQEYLSKLKVDSGVEESVHVFYRRFVYLGPLLEYLVGWGQVGFLQCKHPLCRARFWLDRDKSIWHMRPGLVCPACGGNQIQMEWDTYAYRLVGCASWGFIKLTLGR